MKGMKNEEAQESKDAKRKVEKQRKRRRKLLVSLIGISATLMVFAGLIVVCYYGLGGSLPVDLGMSWVILSLSSMITLSYVAMINKLLVRVHEMSSSLDPDKKDIAKAWHVIKMLSWGCFFLFITIGALVVRIVVLFSYWGSRSIVYRFMTVKLPMQSEPSIVDSVIMASFIMSSIIRACIFFYSYWKFLCGRNLSRLLTRKGRKLS